MSDETVTVPVTLPVELWEKVFEAAETLGVPVEVGAAWLLAGAFTLAETALTIAVDDAVMAHVHIGQAVLVAQLSGGTRDELVVGDHRVTVALSPPPA